MTSQGRGDTSQVTSQVQPLPLQGDVAGHLANPRTLENRQSNQPRILHGIEQINAARFVKENKDSPFACYCKSEGRRLLHKLGAQIRTPGLAGPPPGSAEAFFLSYNFYLAYLFPLFEILHDS